MDISVLNKGDLLYVYGVSNVDLDHHMHSECTGVMPSDFILSYHNNSILNLHHGIGAKVKGTIVAFDPDPSVALPILVEVEDVGFYMWLPRVNFGGAASTHTHNPTE